MSPFHTGLIYGQVLPECHGKPNPNPTRMTEEYEEKAWFILDLESFSFDGCSSVSLHRAQLRSLPDGANYRLDLWSGLWSRVSTVTLIQYVSTNNTSHDLVRQ